MLSAGGDSAAGGNGMREGRPIRPPAPGQASGSLHFRIRAGLGGLRGMGASGHLGGLAHPRRNGMGSQWAPGRPHLRGVPGFRPQRRIERLPVLLRRPRRLFRSFGERLRVRRAAQMGRRRIGGEAVSAPCRSIRNFRRIPFSTVITAIRWIGCFSRPSWKAIPAASASRFPGGSDVRGDAISTATIAGGIPLLSALRRHAGIGGGLGGFAEIAFPFLGPAPDGLSGGPSASNLRNGPAAIGEWYGQRIVIDAETRYINSAYDRDTSLTRITPAGNPRWPFVRIRPWLKIGVRTVGESESEAYVDRWTVPPWIGSRPGFRWKDRCGCVQPQLSRTGLHVFVPLSLAFTRGAYPILEWLDGRKLLFPLYQNYSADDWKAEAGFSILSKAIFFTVSLDYEENWVAIPKSTGKVQQRRGPTATCSGKCGPGSRSTSSCRATRRTWLAPGYASGNIVNMMNLSLGLTSRFP